MTNLKERLKNGENLMGTMIVAFSNPDIVDIVKNMGFDYIIIDCEHGSMTYEQVAGILGRTRTLGLAGIVRIPEVKREVVLKYMEMGADGLLLPNANTVEQVKALVEYSKYAPLGNRGVSLGRAHSGYAPGNDPIKYMQTANEKSILLAQVESPESVKNIEEIMAVEGIDAAFIGPNDLSFSMGMIGEFNNPEFIAALDKVIEAAKKNGKHSGIHLMTSPETILPWMEKGMTLNLWNNEIGMMTASGKKALEILR